MNILSLKESRHTHKNKHIAEAFTDVIYAYINAIQKLGKNKSRPLKGGLDMSLRILTGSHVTFISEKILNRVLEKNLELNPFDLIWEQRHSMGKILVKNRKQSFAVWEHTLPIREFREKLILCQNKKEVIRTINEYPGVAWISREENNTLNSLGYQRNRPCGFLNCYEKASISLLNESMYKKVYNKI